MTSEDLLNTLEDLGDDEFKDFIWNLQDFDIREGCQSVKKSKLAKVERRDTVDLMLNTFTLPGALKVTKKILKKINSNDLVQRLSDASSGPEAGGNTAAASTSPAAPPAAAPAEPPAAAPATMKAQQGSVIIAPTGTFGTLNINFNVTKKVLEKIPRNDLVQSLSDD